MRQDQFLKVVGRDEARRRFDEALRPAPLGVETVPLAESLGRVVAAPVVAPIDVPPFDRSVVDGFAVRAADLAAASDVAPIRLAPTGDVVRCGRAPSRPVGPGQATVIATGGPMPRGADAVVMVEHTEIADDGAVLVRRAAASGANMAFAGSDLARGETVLRRGVTIGASEIGLMAACGVGSVEVFRRPSVAVVSTGDELVPPGGSLPPAGIFDTNGPIVAAAIAENGCTPLIFPIVPDDEEKLAAVLAEARAQADFVVLSGGTSKGAGDLTSRLVGRLGAPGIVVHGVAVKPGKPLCLAVADGKGVVVLPGFPTSAMFTFHEFVVPVLRRLAGLPPRSEGRIRARVPIRVPSEVGRTDYVMVGLGGDDDGRLVAHPVFKGSGAISAFAQADGFFGIEALADHLPGGSEVEVTLFSPDARAPDLVIAGSHCIGLDPVVDEVIAAGFSVRILALGSTGGLAAARRGECDLAPIHLLEAETGVWNAPFLDGTLDLVKGWRRLQGIVFRPGDPRFDGLDARTAVERAVADPSVVMVNRNAGAGTRILLDGLLGGRRPEGWTNQPKSHNAVAAAVAQGRADWGMAIESVATAYGLGFLPFADEHYDFAVVRRRADHPAVAAFLSALHRPRVEERLRAVGFRVG
jgi:putative molybdopterin biosynthesis protein